MTSHTSGHTDCRGGGGEAGQPLGMGVFWQFSLAGNRMAALHLATCVFLAGNHISDEQREIQAKKSLREAEEGEEEKISMKISVKLREIE